MLNRIPRNLPDLKSIMDSLGITPRQAAKALHVSERTVQHWLKHQKEARMARLALFWISHYGFEIVHTEAHNKAMIYANLVRFQSERIKQLENANITPIKKTLQASNDAVFRVIEDKANNT